MLTYSFEDREHTSLYEYLYKKIKTILKDVEECEEKAYILNEIEKLRKNKITHDEFLRGREQLKSSIILGQESTASQMLVYGKHLLFTGEIFNFDDRVSLIDSFTLDDVSLVIENYFKQKDMAVGAVGKLNKAFEI